IRPGGLGSPPLRTAVGLGLPLRGLHARAQAQARLLRAAAAVARPGDRLGQPVGIHGRTECAIALRGRKAAARCGIPAGAGSGTGADAGVPGVGRITHGVGSSPPLLVRSMLRSATCNMAMAGRGPPYDSFGTDRSELVAYNHRLVR